MHRFTSTTSSSLESGAKPRRVLIVGAGASGTAAAYSLGKSPKEFEVHVWEKAVRPGGVATSEAIKGPGDLIINDGVQGGFPTYRNTLNLMSEFGFSGSPIHMVVSFGKGPTAWTNYTKTELIHKHKDEIKKFGSTLRIINKLELLFLFTPISKALKLFGHSESFCHQMVFLLVALFFGTGNQTPSVSAAIIARVFLDDNLRLFDYDHERLLSQSPEMFIFPNLGEMYHTIMKNSGAIFHPNREVSSVTRREGSVHVVDNKNVEEVFDEIIFACDAETVLKVLKKPTFMERKVLGNVQYFNDVTITHEDDEYMNKYYELHKETDQYFIRSDPSDPTKLEMSFNLSNYQPQLETSGRNIYQTIFLNGTSRDTWTIDQIDKKKVLLTKWWYKFSHSWRHFAFTVSLMRYIQGAKHTWYCGTYTFVGTHEVAIISGLAAASRLGARYPFSADYLARKQFEQYLFYVHGRPVRYCFNVETFKSLTLFPFMLTFLVLALFVQFFFKMLGKH